MKHRALLFTFFSLFSYFTFLPFNFFAFLLFYLFTFPYRTRVPDSQWCNAVLYSPCAPERNG